MATDSEREHLLEIAERLSILYGIEGINPMIVDMLNHLALDVNWLADRLQSAWSTVEAYQKEIRRMYYDD